MSILLPGCVRLSICERNFTLPCSSLPCASPQRGSELCGRVFAPVRRRSRAPLRDSTRNVAFRSPSIPAALPQGARSATSYQVVRDRGLDGSNRAQHPVKASASVSRIRSAGCSGDCCVNLGKTLSIWLFSFGNAGTVQLLDLRLRDSFGSRTWPGGVEGLAYRRALAGISSAARGAPALRRSMRRMAAASEDCEYGANAGQRRILRIRSDRSRQEFSCFCRYWLNSGRAACAIIGLC